MEPRFSRFADNIIFNDDTSFEIRQGYKLFADGETGSITDNGSVTLAVSVTSGSNIVTIVDVAHGLSTGNHIEIESFSADIGGIPTAEFNKRHAISVINVNTYTIRSTTNATSTVSSSRTFNQKYNTHLMSGVLVEKWHFMQHDICVDTSGEIFKVDAQGVITRIFDDTFARSLTGAPNAWSPMTFASADVFRGDLIICNGIDKPLLVNLDNTPEVQYLVDIPTGSNANVPVCRYVRSMPDYLTMADDPISPRLLHISHTGASGTWLGDAAPNVATQLDMGRYTPSSNQSVRGLGRFRNFLMVCFDDSVVPVSLGTINSDGDHIPIADDAIHQHGSISHRAIASVGQDMLMVDDAGVPSIAQALFTGSVRPERISELIDPVIRNNIERLSIGEIEDNVFSVFHRTERLFMLFIPNHETGQQQDIPYNGISTLEAGSGDILVELHALHNLRVGETATISGATDIDGILAAQINTTFTVKAVYGPSAFVVETAGTSVNGYASGGGSSIKITYTQTETFCYVYKYAKNSKRRNWSILRGWNWNCVSITQLGRVIFGADRKLYVLGNRNDPINGDKMQEYDDDWATNTAYSVGDIIRDPTTELIYECLTAHTSDTTGTMEDNIARVASLWQRYRGIPITWYWELPWVDNDKRVNLKRNKFISVDAEGTAAFTAQGFVDQLYMDQFGNKTPQVEIELVGGNAGGYGSQDSAYGAGRLTSDERMYAFEMNYKLVKIALGGSDTRPLRISGVSLTYTDGEVSR